MANFTNTDLQNAIVYAEQRLKLETLHLLYKKYPNVASKLGVKVRNATLDDYYFNTSFQNRALWVDIEINERFCNFLACFPSKHKEACTPTDSAHLIRVGQQDNFTPVCQPSCFNLKEELSYDEDGTPQVQMLDLTWNPHRQICAIESGTKTWMLLPEYRSSKMYERRLNDFSVGFDMQSDVTTNSGYSFKMNEYYCNMFDDTFNGRNCESSGWWFLADVLIGKALIQTLKAAIMEATNTPYVQEPDFNIPDIGEEYRVSNWKQDIDEIDWPDPNFSFTDLEFQDQDFNVYGVLTAAAAAATTTTTTTTRKLADESKRKLFKNLISSEKNIDNFKRLAMDEKIKLENLAQQQQSKMTRGIGDPNLDYSRVEVVDQINEIIGSMLTDPALIASIGVDVAAQILSKILKKLSKPLVAVMGRMMTQVPARIGAKIFQSTVLATISKVCVRMAFKTVSKVIVAMTKIIAQVSSVVGIILVVATVFDLIFTFWDPMGFNNKYPDGYLEIVQSEIDRALREQVDMNEPQMSFELLTAQLLTEDEYLENQMSVYIYILEYLDSLEVNSEGSRLDRGDIIEPHLPEDWDSNDHLGNITTIYTQKELREFEEDHENRLKSIQVTQLIGFGAILIGALFLFINLPIVVLVLTLVGLIILIVGYICISSDIVFSLNLTDIFDNYKFQKFFGFFNKNLFNY